MLPIAPQKQSVQHEQGMFHQELTLMELQHLVLLNGSNLNTVVVIECTFRPIQAMPVFTVRSISDLRRGEFIFKHEPLHQNFDQR